MSILPGVVASMVEGAPPTPTFAISLGTHNRIDPSSISPSVPPWLTASGFTITTNAGGPVVYEYISGAWHVVSGTFPDASGFGTWTQGENTAAITYTNAKTETTFQVAANNLFRSGAPGGAWDFSDPTTLFQDAAGTVPVTGFNQPVGHVLDLSGNGYHLTQSAAASRALFTDTLPNGKPSILFDGVDDLLSVANFDLSSTDKVTVFAGVRKISDATISGVLGTGVSLGGKFHLGAPRIAGVGNVNFGASGLSTFRNARFDGVPAPFSFVVVGGANLLQSQVSIRVNQNAPIFSTGSTGGGTFAGSTTFTVGYSVWPFNGYLTSLVVLGREATSDETASMTAIINQQIGAW